MSIIILRKNLEKIISLNDFSIKELERKAGLTRNSIYYILKGTTAKVSVDTLIAIAQAMNLSMDDLLKENTNRFEPLNPKDLMMFSSTMDLLTQALVKHNIIVNLSELTNLVDDIYDYFKQKGVSEPEEAFIQWFVKQKYLNK